MLCCCLGATCSCCGTVLTMTSSKASRMLYFAMFFIVMVVAWIMREEGHYFTEDADNFDCKKGMGYNYKECLNKTTVFRLSLGSCLFHSLMFFVVLGVETSQEPRASLQNSWWIVKIPLWIVFMVLAFHVPHESALDYARTSMFGACVFILIQCVLLVDLGYSLNERWLAKGYLATILMLAGFCYALTITFQVLAFHYFTGSDCDTNNFFASITLISSVVVTALSLSSRINRGILPPAVVSSYISYLLLSALMSEPDKNGNCSAGKTDNPYMVIAGAIVTLLSVAYAANRTAGSGHDFNGTTLESGGGGGSPPTSDSSSDDADDEKNGVAYNYSFFHFIYAMASMFMAMVIVNWEITIDDDPNNKAIDSGWTAVWVKISTQWITILVFAWTLVAPLVCPDRFADQL